MRAAEGFEELIHELGPDEAFGWRSMTPTQHSAPVRSTKRLRDLPSVCMVPPHVTGDLSTRGCLSGSKAIMQRLVTHQSPVTPGLQGVSDG